MKKENVIKMVDSFFAEIEWKYKFDEKRSAYTFGVDVGGTIGSLKFIMPIREHHYKVIGVLNSKVEDSKLQIVAEYLHRANFGLNNGNFELDYNNGEVRYKSFVDFWGIELNKRIIEDSVFIPILMFKRYGKNVIKLMVGEGNPADLIDEAESLDDNEAE